jgi:hypothetical protein
VVTRTLVNTGDPLVDPGGDPIANAVFTFTLVDEAKRQPIALFDSAEEGGELIRGDAETATTNEVGLFTVDLWPNDRGEVATLYKVALTGVVKPFYIRVASGETDLTLIAAKTAYEATSAQTLSLFDALLAQILATVAAIGEVATTIANGLMSFTDKLKLDGIAEGANNYTHPSTDGSLHVPATSTTNNGKVLTAGATAGSLSWAEAPTPAPTLAYGTYTPADGLASASMFTVAVKEARYSRVGSIVTVSGAVEMNPIVEGEDDAWVELSTPISTVFGASQDADGTGYTLAGTARQGAIISSVAGTSKVKIAYKTSESVPATFSYTYQYEIKP